MFTIVSKVHWWQCGEQLGKRGQDWKDREADRTLPVEAKAEKGCGRGTPESKHQVPVTSGDREWQGSGRGT